MDHASARTSRDVSAVAAPSTGHSHAHLWALADGTPAHAPPGRLTLDADGRVACHLCGRWFVHLGAHLRAHGWDPARYREAVGLPRRQPLCSGDLSDRIAARQARRWRVDPALRQRLEPGMELARTGALARRSAAATRDRESGDPGIGRRHAALAAGRETRRRHRDARLDDVVARAGAPDLATLLRVEYARGASLDDLRALTGLARADLRTAMRAAGIAIRPSGQVAGDSRHRRAADVDRAVAHALGVDDVTDWLRTERAAGATLAALAHRTGRSVPWVRSRLAGRTTTVEASAVGSVDSDRAASGPR